MLARRRFLAAGQRTGVAAGGVHLRKQLLGYLQQCS